MGAPYCLPSDVLRLLEPVDPVRSPRMARTEPRRIRGSQRLVPVQLVHGSLKDGDLNELPKRTEALHGLLDVAVGLN